MFARKFRLPAQIPLDNAHTYLLDIALVKIKENGLSYNRYGFVVSKKISKRAHVRNRVKRRFRVCIEKLHPLLRSGYDVLFVLKSSAVKEETQDICTKLHVQLGKYVVK